MLDILLNFNTGFYSRGSLIMNRREIAKNYLKAWFWIDLFSTLPYTWFLDGALQDEQSGDSNLYRAPKLLRLIKIFRFLRILKILRLTKLKRILMKIEDYIASNTLATTFVFLRLLAVVFFIAHWTACWWFFVGNQDSAVYPTTWVTTAKIIDKSYATQYITSLYWAFTTMTTVGYGDITPYTINEKLYAMFTMILACGVFAYTVGSIGSLVSKQNAVENAYREQIVAVNRYMKKKSLPYDLQFRVRRYLEYVWENKKKSNMDEKQILSLLSEPLRDEIYTHIHGVVIKRCTVFQENYDPHFISLLTKALESETFAPGDVIFNDGEFSNKIYFIQNGTVDIFHGKTNSIYSVLSSGLYFGEIAFFIERARCASARCVDFVDLLSLSRSSVNYLLDKFPEAMQATKLLSVQCNEGNLSELQVKCYVCEELGHVALICRKILLNNDYQDTKQRWLMNRRENVTKHLRIEDYDRAQFVRRSKKVRNIHDFKNIVGIPRITEKIFPEESGLGPKIKKFLERPSRPDVISTTNTVNSANETPQVSSLAFKEKKGPKYSLIYRDSESSDSKDYEEEIEYPVARKFKGVLYTNKSENPDGNPEEQSLRSSAKKKSKVSKIIPKDDYKPYVANAIPTPFNTIDEGYEADFDEFMD
jgi:hypothetical protein